MKLALLFPGQGAQTPGMLHSLPDADDLVGAASDALQEDILALDTPDALGSTRNVQLALLLAETAWARRLVDAAGRPDYLAGHSVGLWSAAVATGSVPFKDAVRLVAIRGTAMERVAVRGGMIAVDGLTAGQVDSAAERLRATGAKVWASNVNGPTQVTVSGAAEELDALAAALQELGAGRITHLAVPVAAHTPLMADAAEAVRIGLARTAVAEPRVPVAGNASGRTIFTARDLAEDLVDSITQGVQWGTGIAILSERGVDTWIEIPPGRSLVQFTPPDHHSVAVVDVGVDATTERLRVWRRAAEQRWPPPPPRGIIHS